MKNKVCFISCWFGKLPEYFPVWLKTCSYNPDFDFLLLTDDKTTYQYPNNVKFIPFSKDAFLQRVKKRIDNKPSLQAAYRLCDYRPMYGIILSDEIEGYEYWGYCDIDVVFGSINKFLPFEEIKKYNAVFNGGHFSIVKNDSEMNTLFKQPGALFDYKTVIRKHAIFAFDETTGFQRIVRVNNINAKFGVPYIETESKYKQLRSRMEKSNPEYQAYYWEEGNLYRVKAERDQVFYQELTYIHLQKRKLSLIDPTVVNSEAFWITPTGYTSKIMMGFPSVDDVKRNNPYEGSEVLSSQATAYKKQKIAQLIKRTPFQIYVRIMQQKAGINAGDGVRPEMGWNVCNEV